MMESLEGIDPKLAAKLRLAGSVLAIALNYWTPEAMECLIREIRSGNLTGPEVDEVFDAVLGLR